MDQDQLLAAVAEIQEVEVGEVSMDTSLEDLGWDSMSVIMFIAAVNEATGKTIKGTALRNCSKVSDLAELV